MKIGGHSSYRPPGPFQTLQDQHKPQENEQFRKLEIRYGQIRKFTLIFCYFLKTDLIDMTYF